MCKSPFLFLFQLFRLVCIAEKNNKINIKDTFIKLGSYVSVAKKKKKWISEGPLYTHISLQKSHIKLVDKQKALCLFY